MMRCAPAERPAPSPDSAATNPLPNPIRLRRALALVALAMLPLGAMAQEEPPEGCFCLAEAGRTLPQVIRGCTGEKFPGRFFWHAVCRYVDQSGNEVVTDPIMITEDWKILPMGSPDCTVCEPEKHEGPIVPRGHGGDEPNE
jgi:hypothetical protein